MKFIVWRRFKWVFIGLIILIIVVLFIAILLYSLPVRTDKSEPLDNKVFSYYKIVQSYHLCTYRKLVNV